MLSACDVRHDVTERTVRVTVGRGAWRVLAALQTKAAKRPLAEKVLWVLASRSGFDEHLRRRVEAGDLLLVGPAGVYLW